MSDIVERLRAWKQVRTTPYPIGYYLDTGLEAADEIERLRAERELLAQMMIRQSLSTGHGGTVADLVRELEPQVEWLRAERANAIGVAETKVHGIHLGHDGLYMGVSGGAAMLMAEMLAEQYKQGGGINYVEMRFESQESLPGQRFLVTINRADAKTPHELRVEAEVERDRLRAELATYKAAEEAAVANLDSALFITQDVRADRDRLRAELAAAKSRETMALGFAHAWCCSLLDTARDPRNVEVTQLLADWDAALAKEKKDEA